MNKTIRLLILVLVVGAAAGVITVKQLQHDDTEFEAFEAESHRNAEDTRAIPRLVSLGAGRCIPCKAMEPIREELLAEYGDQLRIEYHDVWQNSEAAEYYKIRLIPTLIYFDADQRELGRTEGYRTKAQILALFAEYGVNLEADQPDPQGAGL